MDMPLRLHLHALPPGLLPPCLPTAAKGTAFRRWMAHDASWILSAHRLSYGKAMLALLHQ